MRRNIILFLMFAFTCVVTACYDDKGSYDYTEVNEISVDSLEKRYEVVYEVDTLKIKPTLTFTIDKDTPDRYSYEWIAVPGTDADKDITRQVISTERDLNYFVELKPASYFLYLKVRDKQTGLLWMNYTTVIVRTGVGLGWLLIGEDPDGYVNVDMIAMPNDTIVMKGLLTDNGLPKLKGPKSIMYTSSGMASWDKYVKLWVATEDRSYYVNTSTFTGDVSHTFEPMVYSYFDLPAQLNPVHMVAKSNKGNMSNTRIVATAEGHVFSVSLFNGELYANPVNRLSTSKEELFKVYPYILSAPGYLSGLVLYDTDNNRFVKLRASASTASELLDGVNEAFPWIQPEGRVLWYAENTMNTDGESSSGNSFALMKDTKTNEFYIYKLYAYSNAYKRGGYAVKSSLALNLTEAKLFGFASKRSLFFYAVGKTLYAYDYNTNHEKLYQMEMEDEITMLKFDIQSNTDYTDLYVATYNSATGGTLQKYVLGTDPNTLELKPDERCRWTGLVKVKDMDWRNSTK